MNNFYPRAGSEASVVKPSNRLQMLVIVLCLIISSFFLGYAANKAPKDWYVNSDELYYGSIAVQYAQNGEYRPGVAPAGVINSDRFYAGHSILSPYLSAITVKGFGVHRWSLRLPSIIAFILSALILIHICALLKSGPLHTLVTLLCYFANPWIIESALTTRPEALNVFGLLLSCWMWAWVFSTDRMTLGIVPLLALGSSGVLSCFVVFNHPVFLGAIMLPPLIAYFRTGKIACYRDVLWPWIVGGMIGFAFLVFWRVFPHWESWKTQFFPSLKQYVKMGSGMPHQAFYSFHSSAPWPLNIFFELRARFSFLGWPYLLWYSALPLALITILKPTKCFWIAVSFSLLFMVCVHCETAIVQSYVVQFAAMWIICSLFCSEREAVSTSLIPVMPLLAFLTVFACTFHFYLFTRPNDVSMDFTLHEHFLKEQYDSIPIGAVVVGSCLEGIIPAWETGHRYYDMEIEPLGFLPGYSEKLRSYYKIAASYSIEEGFDIKANAQD